MNRETFLESIMDVLQTEDEITLETKLEDLEEWDSLSAMATIAFLDKNFGAKVTFSDVQSFVTVGDIAKKAGI